ncbi:zinc finger protein 432 [Rhagoletis pomonella]|uniref:zinc finger protein 432 n=1 Tax=Rhagoletis pomonella TaxID=28610 RepID=UPI0017844756|nr:zinc finger protein 432 [Rhagoletis pomonella]
MQKNKRTRTSEESASIVYGVLDGGQNRSTNCQKGNNRNVLPRGAKGIAQRRNRHPLLSEDGASSGQRIYSNTKLCVICGSSEEIVDLSTNPIMRKTMASYCGNDNLNLDECLSSLCITCVFKSRAIKEVQNNIRVRLYGLSNGLMLKTTEKNELNYEEVEHTKDVYPEETKFGIKKNIEHKTERTLKSIKCANSVCKTTQASPIRNAEESGIVPHIWNNSLTTSIEGSNSNIPLSKHPYHPSSNKYFDKHRIIDKSVAKVMTSDNRNTVQSKNFDMSENVHVPSIQHLESMITEYTPGLQTSMPLRENAELIGRPIPSSQLSSCSNSTYSQNGASHSMLQVIRERSESVLITESGGKINNYKRSSLPQTQRLCQYCGKSYIRKDHLTKHVRRCRNLFARSLPSLATTSEENKGNVSSKRFLINGVNNFISQTTFETLKRERKFHCTECLATMNSLTQLRQHRATHLREYICDMCNKKFSTLHEHDFHRIVCLAERQVWQEQHLNEDEKGLPLNDDNKSIVRSQRSFIKSTASRRITRAQSRARTKVVEKPVLRRRLTVLTSLSQYIYGHTDNENSDLDGCDLGNDDDDDVSVADSMESNRRVYTDDWLDRRNSNENLDVPTMQIDSEKEYDLYLLERLKAQIKAQEFTCLSEDCGFFTDTLLNLMLHDYVHHFKSSWFYCQKCGSVFTSKVFLDYHLDRQNGGRFICYKCNEQFMFQHQLDLHLIAHTKQVSHACDNCKCEFLTEGKLLQHIKLEHNSEIEKKLICIQSKTTFASSRPLYENGYPNGKQNRKYTVNILNMRLPRMPSKRPLELPGHKPYRRRIGVIEFENERNPNCCSCK